MDTDQRVKGIILIMPSLTTIVFTAIILITAGAAGTSSITQPQGSGRMVGIGFATNILFVFCSILGLRFFLSFPRRFVQEHSMQRAESRYTGVATLMAEYCSRMRISRLPALYYVDGVPLGFRSFGTFRNTNIVFNVTALEAMMGDPFSLRIALIHELAHIKSGDTWKIGLSRQIVIAFAILMFLLISVGLSTEGILSKLLMEPAERYSLLIGSVFIGIQIFVFLLLIHYAGKAREYYADAWIMHLEPEITENDILRTWRYLDQPGSSPRHRAGSFLASVQQTLLAGTPSSALDRIKMLDILPDLHKWIRRIAFLVGLAVGSLVGYYSGFNFLFGSFIAFTTLIVWVLVSILYQIPYSIQGYTKWRYLLRNLVISSALYLGGVLAYHLTRILLGGLILTWTGFYGDSFAAELFIFAVTIFAIVFATPIVFLSMLLNSRILGWATDLWIVQTTRRQSVVSLIIYMISAVILGVSWLNGFAVILLTPLAHDLYDVRLLSFLAIGALVWILALLLLRHVSRNAAQRQLPQDNE